MAVKTLNHRTSLLALLHHPTFTANRLRVHPLAAPHVARFEARRVEGRQLLLLELDHVERKAEAYANVVAVDVRLDAFADRLSQEILTLTGKNRKSPLYTHYFEKPLNELTRPVLRGQLEAMTKWMVSLPKSPYPTLAGMVPELQALLEEANAAVEARKDAEQANREFRDVGERRQWVDRLNADRKEVYGALSKLPHEHPHLPADFADQFFARESEDGAGADESEEETVEALKGQAASLREALADVEARIVAAEEAEAAAREAEAVRAAKEAALAELDRAASELEARRAALRAELTRAAK